MFRGTGLRSRAAFPATGLIHAWTYEEAGEPWVDQVGSANMAVSGDVSPASEVGKHRNGLVTAGTPPQSSVAQTTVPNGLGSIAADFTLAYWFKWDNVADNTNIPFALIDDGTGVGYFVTPGGGSLVILDATLTPILSLTQPVGPGTYVNLAIVYDHASGGHRFYVNGIPGVTVLSLALTPNPAAGIAFGDFQGIRVSGNVHWDEVYMWGRKLAASEVAKLQSTFYS